jgi:hypothetical protein
VHIGDARANLKIFKFEIQISGCEVGKRVTWCPDDLVWFRWQNWRVSLKMLPDKLATIYLEKQKRQQCLLQNEV